jgi:hypothetical protein
MSVAAVNAMATGSTRLRALGSLSTYLESNAVFNVLDFAPAKTVINSGDTDATSAWLAARDAAIAAGGGIIHAPAGVYSVDELEFNADGLMVVGAGKGRTVLAARHGGHYVVRWALSNGKLADLTIDGGSRRGSMGLGVVPIAEDGSGPIVHQNWNVFQNIEVRCCDDGIILRAGPDVGGADSGCWYNTFIACEAQDCLRGIWLRSPTKTGGSPPNRNAWYSIRIGNRGAGRCNTGVQIDSGDTNDFFRLSCEGVEFGTLPNHTPTAFKISHSDAVSRAENHYNRIFGFNCEACTRDVECDNPTLEFHGAMISESRCAGKHPLGGLFLHGASEAAAFMPAPRVAQPGWTEPELKSSWSNCGSGYQAAGYYRDMGDVVRLRGVLAGGNTAPGALLFSLPAGHRPSAVEVFAVDSNGAHCAIRISPEGDVRLAAVASPVSISLDGVSFRVS